jgi:hypothetical protein
MRLELEVAADDAPTALARLALRGELASAALGEGRLMVSGIERADIPELLAELVHAGVRVYRANPQEPTLAEVYFALHEELVA